MDKGHGFPCSVHSTKYIYFTFMHLTIQNDLHFLEVEPTILLLRGSLSISWATDIIDGSVQGLRFTFDNGGDE